ncbi:hypothetical protein SUDANB19_03636 [Streptomyces sp. enrichment culture]
MTEQEKRQLGDEVRRLNEQSERDAAAKGTVR